MLVIARMQQESTRLPGELAMLPQSAHAHSDRNVRGGLLAAAAFQVGKCMKEGLVRTHAIAQCQRKE